MKTARNQFLNYDLIRSGRFNRSELALLNIVATYSDRCEVSQGTLAEWLNCSISTVQRTIKSLIAKGILVRTYTLFKRCVLRLKSLEQQKELMSLSGIIKQTFKAAKRQIKKYDRSPVTEPHRSPVTEPTRSKTQEVKQYKNELNFNFQMPKTEKRMSEREFSDAKSAQLAMFRAKFRLV